MGNPANGRAPSARIAAAVTRLDPLGVAAVASAISVAIVATGVAAQIVQGFDHEFGSLLLLGDERSLIDWYSALLLLCCACLMALIGSERRRGREPGGWWLALAAVAAYVAIDEAKGLHEQLIDPIRGALDVGGALYFAWVIPAIGAVAICAAIFARFVLALDSPVRGLLMLAAAIYVSAALGLEMAEGLLFDTFGVTGGAFTGLAMLEESLELSALMLLLYGLLLELGRGAPAGRSPPLSAPKAASSPSS